MPMSQEDLDDIENDVLEVYDELGTEVSFLIFSSNNSDDNIYNEQEVLLYEPPKKVLAIFKQEKERDKVTERGGVDFEKRNEVRIPLKEMKRIGIISFSFEELHKGIILHKGLLYEINAVSAKPDFGGQYLKYVFKVSPLRPEVVIQVSDEFSTQYSNNIVEVEE